MGGMITKLQSIATKDDGYTRELKSLHEGLKSQSQREGRKSTKGQGSIEQLASIVNHPDRARRLREGNFGVLEKHQSLFLDLLKTDTSVVLGSAGETDEVVE
jgi:hypothetical protein